MPIKIIVCDKAGRARCERSLGAAHDILSRGNVLIAVTEMSPVGNGPSMNILVGFDLTPPRIARVRVQIRTVPPSAPH